MILKVRNIPMIQCYQKWNRLLLAILALFFFVLFTIFLIWLDRWNSIPYLYQRDKFPKMKSLIAQKSFCVGSCSYISCSNIDAEYLEILKTEISHMDCSESKIVLNKISFPNGVMSKGWLNGASKAIKSLALQHTSLNYIESGALSTEYFPNLRELIIGDSKILQLNESFFNGGMILNTFEFRFTDMTFISVEENALNGMALTLETLQFQKCLKHTDDLKALTGNKAAFLPVLQSLDLRFNSFEVLPSGIFSNVPNVIKLLLNKSYLLSISKDAFVGINKIETLYINENLLKTLPEGVFDNVDGVYISGNPWICDYRLCWLKDLYLKKLKTFFDSFLCGVKYPENVDFHCSSNTTTTLSPLSSTAAATSTKRPIENIVKMNCQSPIVNRALKTDLIPLKEIYIKGQSVKFSFYQNDGTNNIILNVDGDDKIIANACILSTEAQNTENSYCFQSKSNKQTHQFFLNLEYSKTYTVCLIQDDPEVSPYDCTSIHVPDDYNNQAWLTNKHKLNAIFAVCGGLLIIALLSGLGMFFCIRQNPKLIKGNKRVVIIKNKPINPCLYTRRPRHSIFYPPLSLNSHSDGYLTPKIYDRVDELRNTDESSYFSMWRPKRINKDHLYDAPPLPPNRPKNSLQNRL